MIFKLDAHKDQTTLYVLIEAAHRKGQAIIAIYDDPNKAKECSESLNCGEVPIELVSKALQEQLPSCFGDRELWKNNQNLRKIYSSETGIE